MTTTSDVPTVTARGSAVVRTEPDEADLLITLTTLAADPASALTDVALRSRSLAEMLDELDVASTARSSSGISVQEEFDHTPDGQRSLGHRAASVVAVRLTDLELIGALVTRTSTELAAQLSGPHWRIAPDNPARLEVAQAAAADGRRKAEAYAAGVGARLGALLRMTEPEWAGGVAMGIRRSSARGVDVPVESGEQDVTAAVDVTFALETS